MYYLFTDGSSNFKTKVGGYAYVIFDDEKKLVFHKSRSILDTTNNVMEISAVIYGIKRMKKLFPDENFIIVSDSEYVVKGVNEYLPVWKKNNYKRYDGKPILNLDLWKRLERLNGNTENWLSIEWIKAHQKKSKNEEDKWYVACNNLVDSMAVDIRKKREKRLNVDG